MKIVFGKPVSKALLNFNSHTMKTYMIIFSFTNYDTKRMNFHYTFWFHFIKFSEIFLFLSLLNTWCHIDFKFPIPVQSNIVAISPIRRENNEYSTICFGAKVCVWSVLCVHLYCEVLYKCFCLCMSGMCVHVRIYGHICECILED